MKYSQEMEQNEVKMTPVKYFYDYYQETFNIKTNNFNERLRIIKEEIEPIVAYIKENFTEIPVFGKLDFDNLRNTDLKNYIKSHGSFYITVSEKSFLYKLEELDGLYHREKSIIDQLYRHQAMHFNWKEFKWLIVETHKIMVDQMINYGKRIGISSILGYFAVSARKVSTNERPRVNHPQTQAYKRQLLAEGKTLKSEENPDGHEYKIYYTETNIYRIKWFRNNMFLHTDETKNYRYKSVTGNDSLIGRVYRLIRSKPETKLLYRN